MASVPANLLAPFASQLRPQRETMAATFKKRVATVLESTVPQVIKGNDSAGIDFGVYVGEDEISMQDEIAMLDGHQRDLILIEKYRNDKVILPISVKMVHPHITGVNGFGTFLLNYVIHRSAKQSKSAAYIIGSTYNPDLVAFIPASYIDPQARAQNHSIFSDAMELFPNNPPPFAMEYSPFVLPLNQVGDAVKAMVQCYKDSNIRWHNPHNGIVFQAASRPIAYTADILLSTDNNLSYEEDMNDRLERDEARIIA